MKKPTAFEQQILDALLRELRRAMRAKRQFSILVDPFTNGEHGCYVNASSVEDGVRQEFTRAPPKRKVRRG